MLDTGAGLPGIARLIRYRCYVLEVLGSGFFLQIKDLPSSGSEFQLEVQLGLNSMLGLVADFNLELRRCN